MCIAFIGVSLIFYARLQEQITILPLIFALIGALGAGIGNIELKKLKQVNTFAFTVWMSMIPPLPLLFMSLAFEGDISQLILTISQITWIGISALLFLSLIATLFALGIWAKLLTLYPANIVVPYSLLSPIFGLVGSHYLLAEQYNSLNIFASVLIISALIANTYQKRLTNIYNDLKLESK